MPRESIVIYITSMMGIRPSDKDSISSSERQPTPVKFNMEPENDGFQKESPYPGTSFQVPC